MWIVATVTAEEARGVLARLLPVTVRLDDEPGTERYVVLDAPTDVSLVEGRGLRVTCPGRVSWSLPIGTIDMRIKRAQALLVPSIVTHPSGEALRFTLEIETLDFEWVPSLVDQKIADVIEKRLGAEPLEWGFAETFTRTFALPAAVEPKRDVAVTVREPSCAVTEIAMTFVLYVAVLPTLAKDAG